MSFSYNINFKTKTVKSTHSHLAQIYPMDMVFGYFSYETIFKFILKCTEMFLNF